MAFKLAVDDLVGVTIKGINRKKDGNEKEFKFILVCDRLDQEQLKTAVGDGKTSAQFFEEHATDWQRQDLVLDEDNKPAAFSLEALRVLMTMPNMANLCWASYLHQVQANAKN